MEGFDVARRLCRMLDARPVLALRRELDAHGPPLIQTVRGGGSVLRSPRT